MSHVEMGQHRLQGEAVVGVGGGEADAEGQSACIGQDVHFGTRLARVHGRRTCEFAPLFARTWAASSTVRDRSTSPCPSRSSSTFWWSRPQTPARDHIRNRRSTVDFDAPKHGGRARQAQPLTSTYTIAA